MRSFTGIISYHRQAPSQISQRFTGLMSQGTHQFHCDWDKSMGGCNARILDMFPGCCGLGRRGTLIDVRDCQSVLSSDISRIIIISCLFLINSIIVHRLCYCGRIFRCDILQILMLFRICHVLYQFSEFQSKTVAICLWSSKTLAPLAGILLQYLCMLLLLYLSTL